MSCSICSDCDGDVDDTAKSLDLSTDFRDSDCEIDRSNDNSYWQDLTIDSNRATDSYIRVTADSPNNQIDILSSNSITKTVPAYKSRDVNFEIEKAQNASQNQGTLEIEIEFRRRRNKPWNSICTLSPERELA